MRFMRPRGWQMWCFRDPSPRPACNASKLRRPVQACMVGPLTSKGKERARCWPRDWSHREAERDEITNLSRTRGDCVWMKKALGRVRAWRESADPASRRQVAELIRDHRRGGTLSPSENTGGAFWEWLVGAMKQLISSRTLAIPEGVEVQVKSRSVKVTGPRGTFERRLEGWCMAYAAAGAAEERAAERTATHLAMLSGEEPGCGAGEAVVCTPVATQGADVYIYLHGEHVVSTLLERPYGLSRASAPQAPCPGSSSTCPWTSSWRPARMAASSCAWSPTSASARTWPASGRA